MKKALLTVLFAGIFSICFSQEVKVNVDKLVGETQKLSSDDHKVSLVWWVPVDFWKAVLSASDKVTKEQAAEMIGLLKDYNIVAVVDGKIGALANITYTPKEQLASTIFFKSPAGIVYKPLNMDEVNSGAKTLIEVMKPIVANMVGNMGQNLQFFVFPAFAKDSSPVVDPRSPGILTVGVVGDEFNFQLPLESLLKPKTCPVDKKQVPGSWLFCPWHGTKLID